MAKIKEWYNSKKEFIKKWSFRGIYQIVVIIIALLVTTNLHTADINLQHYFPGEHFFGKWSDFCFEVYRIQKNYNDNYNFTFDIAVSNRWLETRTALIKISIDSSNNKIGCVNEGQDCDDIYVNLPPNVGEKKIITPTIIIQDLKASDIVTDGYNLCIDVIDNNNQEHNIKQCRIFYILDR